MDLIDLTLPDPGANLALDESLLRALEDAGRSGRDPRGFEVLRLWENPCPVVVLGRSGRLDDEVHAEACETAGVPVLNRASGGGSVLLGPGCLCFTLVLAFHGRPGLRDVSGSFRFILGRIVRALDVPGLAVRGGADLALRGRKVSGNAQLRGRYGLLHQGTLLQAFDRALLPRLLREPRRQPSYRRHRPHLDFVANLPLAPPLTRSRLAAAWNARPRGAPRVEH